MLVFGFGVRIETKVFLGKKEMLLTLEINIFSLLYCISSRLTWLLEITRTLTNKVVSTEKVLQVSLKISPTAHQSASFAELESKNANLLLSVCFLCIAEVTFTDWLF